MAGGVGKLREEVWERGLDEEGVNARLAVDEVPEVFRGGRVGAKRDCRPAVCKDHADRGDDVADGDCRDAQVRDAELLARAEGDELHDGRRAVVEVLEGRVDRAVENIARDEVADLLSGVDADGFFEEGEEVVNEYGERGEVVYVRVRDDYVAHALALGGVETDGDAPGVERHAPVNDEAA